MANEETHEEALEKLRELTRGIRFAMLTTVCDDGALHSRPMAAQEVDADGNLWFFTSRETHKIPEIEAEHHVNVSFASPDKDRYVSVAGRAKVIDDRGKARELWNPAMKAWFPDGPESSDLCLLQIRPESAMYWDAHSSKMVQLFGLAKAVLTGKRYGGEITESGTLDLGAVH